MATSNPDQCVCTAAYLDELDACFICGVIEAQANEIAVAAVSGELVDTSGSEALNEQGKTIKKSRCLFHHLLYFTAVYARCHP
jgi:hypothetical protein